MAELVAGGAVGVPFNILYDVLKEVMLKSAMFKPLFLELNSKIEALKPLIVEMDKWNKQLDRSEMELKEFKLQMEMAPVLLRKCCKLSWYNRYKMFKYTNQLIKLKGSLEQLMFILQMQEARDNKENLVVTKNVEEVVQGVDVNVVELNTGMKDVNGKLDELLFLQTHNKKGELQNKIDCEVPELPPLTVGLDGPLMDLKIKLLGDDKVSMLVLSAPGGCGKTTLAKKFCKDKEVKDIFKDNIFFVTVSKKPTFSLIVQGLYQRKSAGVPNFEDDETAVKWLRKFLVEEGQNRVLVVLDDVWSDTEAILEKFEEVKLQKNLKILVTSRTRFSRYGFVYHVKSLNEKDAMTLFLHSASLEEGQNRYAKKIAASCKGYPLVITVVAKSLCGKADVIWHKKESELSTCETIKDFETQLLIRLQSSLDCLGEEETTIKECFIDLGAFPQDQRIPTAALIDMWAELYEGLDEDYKAVANLHELANRSLADILVTRKETLGDDDGYYSEHFVTQHDLLRQLAVYQAKLDKTKKRLFIIGNNLPKCVTQQTDEPMKPIKPIKPRLLSISSDKTFLTKLHNIELADVEVFVLNFNTENYDLPGFMEEMVNLKVLILRKQCSNQGFSPAELGNFHLLDSLQKLKRIRLERISIPSIIKKSVHLKSLKKISLFMCSIGQAFSNCSFQISDAFPNLEEVNIDYCNDLVKLPDGFHNLVGLKKLSITNCHRLTALPEEIVKLEKLEILRLRSCSDLVILPYSIENLVGLKMLDISDCFSIKELPKDIGKLNCLRRINMRQCSRLRELPVSVGDFQEVPISDDEPEKLEVICDEDTLGLWEPFLNTMRNVELQAVKEKFDLNWL